MDNITVQGYIFVLLLFFLLMKSNSFMRAAPWRTIKAHEPMPTKSAGTLAPYLVLGKCKFSVGCDWLAVYPPCVFWA